MRAALLSIVSLSLACASSSTPEAEAEPEAVEAAPAPAEVEGPAPAEATGEPGLCVVTESEGWSECAGKKVQIRGRTAQMVMQHPIVAQPEGISPDGRNTQQGYIDALGRQLIVLTSERFDCPGELSVVGTLDEVSLGNESEGRGKDSYSGWSIIDAEVRCE